MAVQVNRQGIEGVPAHLKVVAYRPRKSKEEHSLQKYVSSGDALYTNGASHEDQRVAIVEPDNVYNVYDLADVKVPAGYTIGDVIEFREPQLNEYYISPKGGHYKCWTDTFATEDTCRIIIKPIKKTKRVLVVEDEDLLPIDFIQSVSACTKENLDLYLRFAIIEREVD